MILFFAAAAVVFQMPTTAPVDENRELAAIKAVENWDGHTPGAAHEWGYFQFTPAVWRRYTRIPQRKATPTEEFEVARQHLRWVRSQLEARGLPATPYFIALGWCAGVNAVAHHTANKKKREYAQRAENLYNAP